MRCAILCDFIALLKKAKSKPEILTSFLAPTALATNMNDEFSESLALAKLIIHVKQRGPREGLGIF